ncbi:MAG: hypothetical protein QM488_12810 [Rhizobiaceae bacterium]
MATLREYYADKPLDRLERGVQGLSSVRNLLEGIVGNDFGEVSPVSLAALVEIIQDDMERAIVDYYALQNVG